MANRWTWPVTAPMGVPVSQLAGAAHPVTAAAPTWWIPVGTAVLAGLVAVVSLADVITGGRRLVTTLNALGTIVHEGGHAVASVITGGGVYRVTISTPDQGETHWWFHSRIGDVATSAAGYAMPPLAGLGAAVLLHRGNTTAVLILTVVAMGLLLVVSGDLLTAGCVLAIGAAAFATARWAPAGLQTGVAYTEAWLLMSSEIAGVAGLIADRVHGELADGDDAANLADKTGVPGFVWIAGWLALIGWALWRGAALLWP